MIAMLINPYVLYQSLNVPWLNGLFSWIDVASSDTSSVVLGFCVASISTYVTYVKLRYYGLTLRMLLLVYPFFPIKWCKQISQYEQKYTELSSHVKSVQVKQTPKTPKTWGVLSGFFHGDCIEQCFANHFCKRWWNMSTTSEKQLALEEKSGHVQEMVGCVKNDWQRSLGTSQGEGNRQLYPQNKRRLEKEILGQ